MASPDMDPEMTGAFPDTLKVAAFDTKGEHLKALFDSNNRYMYLSYPAVTALLIVSVAVVAPE